jgi:hypothetical protein
MIEECARPGKLQSTIQQIWLPLFTPPPPTSYIPKDVFMAKMKQAVEPPSSHGAPDVMRPSGRFSGCWS